MSRFSTDTSLLLLSPYYQGDSDALTEFSCTKYNFSDVADKLCERGFIKPQEQNCGGACIRVDFPKKSRVSRSTVVPALL